MRSSGRKSGAAALLAGLLLACADASGPPTERPAKLTITASVAGTPINTLSVEATAPDIVTPLIFNIEIVNGTASGTITIPAGSARTLTVRGFDEHGVETHRGAVTVNVQPGTNPAVHLTLLPLSGNQPIVVTISGVLVTVSPAASTIPPGQTLQLSAAITDGSGNPVAGQVVWATLNPAVATASQGGLVTGVAPGQAQIVATFAGVGGYASVTVSAATQLAFVQQPQSTAAGSLLPAVQVAVRDGLGNVVTGATDPVTLAITAGTGTAGAVLSGTLTADAVAGIAAFSDLSVDRGGTGYTLTATSAGLAPATSAAFDVTAAVVGSVSAGALDACGVTLAGAAYCWGWNGNGQLGDGTTTPQSSPVAVLGGLSFTAVSAGAYHTCGLTGSGAAYCWGANLVGALGDGTTTDRAGPTAVVGDLAFAMLSAGRNSYTCGVTTAGAAYCWGGNGFGQLGDGTTTERHSPTAVASGLTFASLSADADHTCGVTTSGAAYCWGLNTVGQLGDGTTTNRTSPTAVAGGLTFAAVSAGFDHVCGLTTTGAAYCWGENSSGQLGDGTTTRRSSPVAVEGGLTFVRLSAGSYHTCGVAAGGAAYCWGDGPFGELGDGTTTGRTSPVAVSGGLSFVSVSAGENYTCAVTPGGAAYCWGYNGYGNLGNGTTTDATTPVVVSGGLSFR